MAASMSTSSIGPLNAAAPVPQSSAGIVSEPSARPVLMTCAHRAAAVVNAACCEDVIEPPMRTVIAKASELAAPTVTVVVAVRGGATPSLTKNPMVLVPTVVKLAERIDAVVQFCTVIS